MDFSRRAIFVDGPSATAKTRSRGQSYSLEKPGGPNWQMRFWHWCVRCSARARQRAALSNLDDRLLEDIGVTLEQANAEAAKPFWK